jgi:hypothetical protein
MDGYQNGKSNLDQDQHQGQDQGMKSIKFFGLNCTFKQSIKNNKPVIPHISDMESHRLPSNR